MTTLLRFEHPLNEPARTWLRIEHLFQRAHDPAPSTPNQIRNRLERLFEIAEICERPDLRSDLNARLEEIRLSLERFRDNPAVNAQMFNNSIQRIEQAAAELRPDLQSNIRKLREHPILHSLAQRRSIPGGACEFDLPEVHAWLHQPRERLDAQLNQWFGLFDGIYQAVELILTMLRQSARPRAEIANQGYFQDSLKNTRHIDLLQIHIDADCGCYCETSGNKHRITLRFMTIPDTQQSSQQSQDDIPFQIVECGL